MALLSLRPSMNSSPRCILAPMLQVSLEDTHFPMDVSTRITKPSASSPTSTLTNANGLSGKLIARKMRKVRSMLLPPRAIAYALFAFASFSSFVIDPLVAFVDLFSWCFRCFLLLLVLLLLLLLCGFVVVASYAVTIYVVASSCCCFFFLFCFCF